jgi:phosphoserine phosphatase
LAARFTHVLNVIAKDAAAAARQLRAFGEPVWLSQGYAFDLPFSKAAGDAAQGIDGDVNVVACDGRRKKLLIADMDSTIIGCECLDELADQAGLKPRIAAITERAMRGEIAFVPALRERVALLKGLPLAALERTWRERVRLNPGAKALIATMKKRGARTLLVSGGFTYFAERVAEAAGFDEFQANVLLDDGAVLTGALSEPILGREAKREALEREAARLEIDVSEALAVGDGANDLDMIGRAGLGVAYHAKPVMAQAAAARIDGGDLRALLYLQGYPDDEIVED